ncbi:MAG: hypothetical protein WA755_12155 [Candidatus Acidiferrales bacterium]
MNFRPLSATVLLLSALLLAPRSPAQEQSPAPPPAPATANNSPAPANPAPAKKVWTNDDISSNAGASSNSNGASKSSQAKLKNGTAKGKDAAWYRTQFDKLNGQVADIDGKIADYQSALNGNPTAALGVQPNQMRRADWQGEIDTLQKQRRDLVAKISALQDQARHDGVEPGQLR